MSDDGIKKVGELERDDGVPELPYWPSIPLEKRHQASTELHWGDIKIDDVVYFYHDIKKNTGFLCFRSDESVKRLFDKNDDYASETLHIKHTDRHAIDYYYQFKRPFFKQPNDFPAVLLFQFHGYKFDFEKGHAFVY